MTNSPKLPQIPKKPIDRLLERLRFNKAKTYNKKLSLEEHHGFNPEVLPDIFNRWKLCKKERWEFGCNYLFIFEIGL